jgi:hypothetical protein
LAGIEYQSRSFPTGHRNFAGGLNSTAGPLGVQDNEASKLLNVDFNKFGSFIKRNGYTALNTSAITASNHSYGLHWYEYDASGTTTRELIAVNSSGSGGQLIKMDSLDGTWDDANDAMSGSILASDCDFVNFLNEVHICQVGTIPFKYDGTNTDEMTVPTNLTDAVYNEVFNNYLFLGNCTVDGTKHGSRIYWYNIKSNSTITDTDFIDIAKNDGQEIRRLKVLGDRLVVYKDRSIYNVFFTGDADIPFVLPGGGKSNSHVGCIAPFSVQEVDNGHVFLSHDGFYFYDGMNSFKISDKISATLQTYNGSRFNQAKSLVQKDKNRYWCALPGSSGSTTLNDQVVVWDFFNNAFSIYEMTCSSLATVYVAGLAERPYFFDNTGFCYRADTGTDDYKQNAQTAIRCYYYTGWKHYDDVVDKKGVPHITLFYQTATSTLTLGYSYDLESSDQYQQTFELGTSGDVYGTALYGIAKYASSGGAVTRRDLTGQGRLIRFKFQNNNKAETLQIDGLGVIPHLTQVA